MTTPRQGPNNFAVVVVLALLALVAAQDFIFADVDSAQALKNWWVDASFHIVNIDLVAGLLRGGAFLGSSGADGGAAGLYHFLSYLPASLGCVLFGYSPLKSYALLYVPLSFFSFLFGLWLITAYFWGRERALWATVVFVLLPDVLPYVGATNEFLRLKWLVSVSPGLGYGVFVSALAWVVTLKGIRETRIAYVAFGWLICAATVLVKAHLFVANVLPLVVYTLARYPALPKSRRASLLIVFLVAYAATTWAAGMVLSIPLIRLDFSNAANYAATLANFYPNDPMSADVLRRIAEMPHVMGASALAVMLPYMHFGILLVVTLLMLYRDIQRGAGEKWIVTLAVFSVYVLHAVGLSRDTRPYAYSGESIELIHRPFVWGVSLIAIWTLSSLATRYSAVLTAQRRWLLALLMLPIGTYFFHNQQFSPRWQALRIDYSTAYFEALAMVANTSKEGELVQASDLDPFLATRAITRRPPYAIRYAMRAFPSPAVAARADEVTNWMRETDPVFVSAFAARTGIGWLIVRDGAQLAWPATLIDQHTRYRKDGVIVLGFVP